MDGVVLYFWAFSTFLALKHWLTLAQLVRILSNCLRYNASVHYVDKLNYRVFYTD
ncbi:hypothetical protein PILCRDRAFT_277051 [Piloderma croceum F 1598]|uniref:Uncharacterized protein n=1 Tax=Piloderma croceum (strain F 1598) TaxID=765440 RepID=A0A0C3CCM7_PILCF|nr:hypothetical protein PILCRDRAFT_277051 [Piloderma croceum F 1598]